MARHLMLEIPHIYKDDPFIGHVQDGKREKSQMSKIANIEKSSLVFPTSTVQ